MPSFPSLLFPQPLGSGGLTAPPPFPWLWLQPFELNKLAAGGLAIRSSPAWALYLLIYIPRGPCAGRSFVSGSRCLGPGPRRGARPPRPLDPQGQHVLHPPARPAEGAEAPAFLLTHSRPEGGAAAAEGDSCPARGARQRGGCSARAPGHSWRRRRRPGRRGAAGRSGCSRALPDWLAARTRPDSHVSGPLVASSPARAGPLCVGRTAVEAREGDAAGDELIAGEYAAAWPREAARSRFSPSRRPALGFEIMSIHIVALGNEGDAFHQDNRPSGLIRTYLGRSPLVSGDESSLLLNATSTVARPVFTEYQASAFGNVKLVVHDCPVWDIFDSDWYTSRNLIGSADIIVIKYNVNDKFSFHEVKDNYIPVIKRALNSVPVIIAAVGTRQNELPCTCPLCTSDRGSCVSTTEGIQLAKELGATYLELHSLDDFYIGKYFGGVLEYFMIQALNQKTSEKMKKRKMSNSFHGVRPPQLEQPEKMPVLKAEASHYNSDLNNLLFCCQCVDVVFYNPDLKEVAEAHKIVLCAVSHVFMLLFNVKSPADIQDSSIIRTTQDLFAINRDTAFPGASQDSPGNPPLRVIVKDALFCSCLSDILRFIYSGAFQWEELEEDIRKKLKDSGDVSNVIEKVKCILKTPGKINCLRNCKTYQARKPLWFYNTSLKFFLNKPMLADVVFEIQGTTVPAHRAILVARCEVMAAMFNGNYMEAKSVLIPVYGVSKETFLSFLEYLYTDSCCPAGIFQAMCLLICAEMYQVSRLQHICELFIITQLQSMPSRELASMNLDIVDLLKKAKFHHSECLSTWLLHFIATNYLIFSQKPEFQDLSVEERSFVEKHRWPSNMYLKQLAEYRKYIHSRKCRCLVM
ncbi:rho-related BTB domain-containing protein 3 isoform X2 [Leopardus geoffroyi]|nr:rho-related BTB domain-containing protein 3 isoform X2 [Leopardus geoffroyi]